MRRPGLGMPGYDVMVVSSTDNYCTCAFLVGGPISFVMVSSAGWITLRTGVFRGNCGGVTAFQHGSWRLKEASYPTRSTTKGLLL